MSQEQAEKKEIWGQSIGIIFGEVKTLAQRIEGKRKELRKDEDDLFYMIGKINEKRIKRVMDSLLLKNKAICLLHSLVFHESKPEECVVPLENTRIIKMVKSWQVDHRIGDSDHDYTEHQHYYETVACNLCRQVVSHSSVHDRDSRADHVMLRDQKELKHVSFEELYRDDVVDMVSEKYFGMPPVTLKNLESLKNE